MTSIIRQCQCEQCLRPEKHPERQLHHHTNVFLSRLDEAQRRWYVALESKRVGHGGNVLLSKITGMDVETIRRGQRELEVDLANSPAKRQRVVGGGSAIG